MGMAKVKARLAASRESAQAAPRDIAAFSGRVMGFLVDATGKVPESRLLSLIEQWQAGSVISTDDIESMTRITGLMMDLAVYTPAILGGQTAIDRLFRSLRPTDPEDILAFEVLRQARPRIGHVAAIEGRNIVCLRDLATGEEFRVADEAIKPAGLGHNIFARFALFPDGLWRRVSLLLPLDAAALAVAMAYVRPQGRGIPNPQRCAEAVYRHMARNGFPVIPGLNELEAMIADLLDEESDDPLDEIAEARASLGADEAPPAELVQELRQLASVQSLLNALTASVAGKRSEALRNAYDWAAWVMIDTLDRRACVRKSMPGVEAIRAELEAAIAAGAVPPAARARFEHHAARLRPAAPAGEDSELDKLIKRIRHLRARTVEQGCTEAEAMAAAEKVAELLDRHGLSLSDVDYRRQSCDSISLDTGRRRGSAIDDCVPAIAEFFDCRCWFEIGPDGGRRVTFFGVAGDVQGAHYLYDLIVAAFETEGRKFNAAEFYQNLHSRMRRRATSSFQHGLARGINEKLYQIKQRRDAALRASSGRDLVPIKAGLVDEEAAKLGLTFTSKSRAKSRTVISGAYRAGEEAGQRFEYAPGLESGVA